MFFGDLSYRDVWFPKVDAFLDPVAMVAAKFRPPDIA
jgi:hypothetical protein